MSFAPQYFSQMTGMNGEAISIIRLRNAHNFMNSQKQYAAANSYTRGVLWPSKYAKMHSRPELRAGSRWESLRRSPIPHSRMGKGYLLPSRHPNRPTRRNLQKFDPTLPNPWTYKMDIGCTEKLLPIIIRLSPTRRTSASTGLHS